MKSWAEIDADGFYEGIMLYNGNPVSIPGYSRLYEVRHRCVTRFRSEHIALILESNSDSIRPIHHWRYCNPRIAGRFFYLTEHLSHSLVGRIAVRLRKLRLTKSGAKHLRYCMSFAKHVG
jgi:hypothetical protein